jgi:hypothetical protein
MDFYYGFANLISISIITKYMAIMYFLLIVSNNSGYPKIREHVRAIGWIWPLEEGYI